VRRVDAPLTGAPILSLNFFDCARQLLQIALNQPIHSHFIDRARGQLLAARVEPGPEEGTARNTCLLDIFVDGLGRREVQTDGAALVAFLVQLDRRFIAS
jgi:hypothetical protein